MMDCLFNSRVGLPFKHCDHEMGIFTGPTPQCSSTHPLYELPFESSRAFFLGAADTAMHKQ